MLAIYGITHSLLLGGANRDFPFTEDETCTSGTFREQEGVEVDKLRKGADYRLWLKDLTEEKDIVDFMDVETNRMAVGDFREIGDRIGTCSRLTDGSESGIGEEGR